MTTLPMFAFNVGHVSFWRSAAPHYGVRTWQSAMARFARQHGQAICHMADDSARIVDQSGKVTILPAGAVRWQRS